MSGPTDFHGRALLATLECIDSLIERAVTDGAVPVLDAVEMAKLLRALIRGEGRYEPNIDALRTRLDRMQASVSNPIAKIIASAPDIRWGSP